MKKIRIFLLLLTLVTVAFYSFQDPSKWPFRSPPQDRGSMDRISLSRAIHNAGVIAIVTVAAADVTSVAITNPAGQVTTRFFAKANVERVLKGRPPQTICLEDEGGFFNPLLWRASPSRYLVTIRRLDYFCTPARGMRLAGVVDSGTSGRGRMFIWGCTFISEDELLSMIPKD